MLANHLTAPVIIAKNWWSLVIRGSAAIALGAVTVLWREMPLDKLAVAFFGYALLDGLAALAGAVRAIEIHDRWSLLLIEALVGIAAAIVLVTSPSVNLFGLMYIIAAWALATGVLELIAGLRLQSHIHGQWLLAIAACASLVLGLLMIALALAGPSRIAFWVGAYALVFGALLISLGLRLRVWLQ